MRTDKIMNDALIAIAEVLRTRWQWHTSQGHGSERALVESLAYDIARKFQLEGDERLSFLNSILNTKEN